MKHDRYWVTEASDHGSIRAYHRKSKDHKVDMNLWKLGKEFDSYVPRRDTKEGRALYKEFEKLPKWDTKELEELTGYKMLWDSGYVYFFAPFHYPNGFCGIKVPVFDSEDYKRDPKLRYKPVKGMKELSWKTHNKKSAMSSKEYSATISGSRSASSQKKKSPIKSKRSSRSTSESGSNRTMLQ